MFAEATASRWDADDDEEAEAKPVKSRWGDDEHGETAALDEDERPENTAEDSAAARENPENAEEGDKRTETDAPVANSTDAPDQKQDTSNTRKSKRNMLFGCRSKEDFEHLRDIGQGTYGAVSKCAPPSAHNSSYLNCVSSSPCVWLSSLRYRVPSILFPGPNAGANSHRSR